ncbi:MAG: response regulator, partial [Isosphaeraceae bacterium]|nr:response regulator [Isosphaeraceae bacterium]
MSQNHLLIVHSDPSVRALMTSMLQTMGHRIDEAPNDRAAVRMLEQGKADLVLAGADPGDPEALEFLIYLRRKHPRTPVILLFETPHPERAREAALRGAAAVLKFPLPATQLRAAVAQVLGVPDPAGGGAAPPAPRPSRAVG